MESNLIYCGDNLETLAKFPEKSVDLIYADPPFFSNKNYEIIWDNGAEMKVYEDRWKGGINVYIEWMKERLWQCHRVLRDTGSMYLHCDFHANHRLRIAMDDIFDEKNFQNEIIWHYGRWTAASKTFQRMHDTLLFYTKTDHWIFNKQYQPFSEKTVIAPYKRKVENSRAVQDKNHLMERDPEKGVSMHDVWDIPFIHPMAKERVGESFTLC